MLPILAEIPFEYTEDSDDLIFISNAYPCVLTHGLFVKEIYFIVQKNGILLYTQLSC